MSEPAQRKGKQKWAVEKPNLDNARRLRGIYFIDLADEETVKKRAEKVGSSDASSNALQDKGERQVEKVHFRTRWGKSSKLRMVICTTEKKDYSCLCMWTR